MFRIGDFSRLARVTIKTLRHYDDAGLLTPAHVDAATGYRYYSADQLPRLQRILALKDIGLTLDEIGELVELPNDDPHFLARLKQQRSALAAALAENYARLHRLDALHDSIAQGHDTGVVTCRQIPAIEVLSQRRRVAALGLAVERMFEAAEAAASSARADASPFLLFHDAEFRDADIDVEVCIPVKPEQGTILQRRVVPATAAACLTYTGDYERTPHLYEAMLRWLERSDLTVAGPLREVYHRFGANQSGYRLPQRVLADKSDDFVTELQVPVAPIDRSGDMP